MIDKELSRNGSGYYDPTAYEALKKVQKGGNMENRTGEIWEVEIRNGRQEVLVIADNGRVATTLNLCDERKNAEEVEIVTVRGKKYTNCRMMGYVFNDNFLIFVASLKNEAWCKVHNEINTILGEGFFEETILTHNVKEVTSEADDEFAEKIADLKETLADLEQANGGLTQAKTANYIQKYMKVIGL